MFFFHYFLFFSDLRRTECGEKQDSSDTVGVGLVNQALKHGKVRLTQVVTAIVFYPARKLSEGNIATSVLVDLLKN